MTVAILAFHMHCCHQFPALVSPPAPTLLIINAPLNMHWYHIEGLLFGDGGGDIVKGTGVLLVSLHITSTQELRALAVSVLGFGSFDLRLYKVCSVYQRSAVEKVVPVSPGNVALIHETYLSRLFRG